MIDFYLEMVFY